MSREHLNLLEQAAKLQTGHDAEGLASLFLPEAIFEDVPFGKVARGHAEMKAFWKETWTAIPDFTMELTSTLADAERGAAEWIMSGTQRGEAEGIPATGASFRLRAATVVRFAGGKILHWSDYWSLETLKKQIGAE